MAEQKEMHFEVIDNNKARAYEEQKKMKQECQEFLDTCSKFHLQEIYAEIKRMKRNKI